MKSRFDTEKSCNDQCTISIAFAVRKNAEHRILVSQLEGER